MSVLQVRVAILAVAAVFMFPISAWATAIVAVWFPAYVIIGADGREVMSDGRTLEICKISVVGNVAVAEAGWLEIGTKDKMTTIDSLIREQLDKGGGASSDHIPSVETMMFNLIKGIDDQRKVPGSPFVDPQFLGSQLFFAYNRGGEMIADDFIAAFDSNISGIREQTARCPSAECTPGTVFTLGHRAEIAEVLAADPTIAMRLGPIAAIREILGRVAAKIPDVVGPPMSIIKVTPDGGHEWIDKGKCGD